MKRLTILLVILAAAMWLLPGCGQKKAPEDFSFALAWNCNADSRYDSATGKLVKTTHLTTHPEDYVTEYHLTEEERQQVWELICDLDAESYPDQYDPGAGLAKPPLVLILTVRTAEGEKSITAVAADYESDNAKGQRFLDTCRAIEELLTGTEAWQALPECEFFYQ